MLSGGDSPVLRERCGFLEMFHRNHHIHGLYLGEIHETLKRKVMKNESKVMLQKAGYAVAEQSFVAYVQIFSDKTATDLNSTAIVAYVLQAAHMNFMYSF